MAEFVEFRMEGIIPEMEEMERLGILTNNEVKKLIHKRKDFEYRLARRSKRKADFINYINYEMKLLELIRIRRKQNGTYEKRHQIEASISRRVFQQARLLTRLWPSHLDTWALRISFSHFVGWKEEISVAYTEQVNFHGNNENVWVAWAKWEVNRKNFDNARAILLSKAPLYHPKSWLIKRELFRLELLYVEMLINKLKHENIAGLEEVIAENRDKVLSCAVAHAVYLNAVNTLPDPKLYLELYQVADIFEFAHKLREEIYRDLCTKFPSAECIWKLKAKRLISGLEEANVELFDTGNTSDRIENSEVGNSSKIGKPGKSTKHNNKDIHEKNNEDGENVAADSFEAENKEELNEEEEETDSSVDNNEMEQENNDTEKEEEEEGEEGNKIKREEHDAVEEIEVNSNEKDKEDNEVEDSDIEDEDGNSEGMEEEEINEGIQKKDQTQCLSANVKKDACVRFITQNVKGDDIIKDSLHKDDMSRKLNPKEKLELFISIFDKAMKVVGSKFVTTYINELMLLLHQCWGKLDMTSIIYKKLFKLFDHYTTLLSPLHFYIWYQILCWESKDKHKVQAVLKAGVKQNPTASHLQLELARWIMKEADTDIQIMKEFKKIGSSMRGECGLTAWRELTKHLCKDNNKRKLFKAALDHEDQTVARGMRVLHLQDIALQDGITEARKLFQKLQWRPPFCGHLQAQMVELELTQDPVNVQAVRDVFTISIQQQGSTNPGLWLAYFQFEKKYGDPLKTGSLLTQAEKELKAQQAHVFCELLSVMESSVEKKAGPAGTEHSNKYFIEKAEDEESQFQDSEPQAAFVSLFEEEITLSYTANHARTTFFTSIHSMESNISRGNKPVSGDNGTEWEKVLELLVGHKISLNIQEVKLETICKKNNFPAKKEKCINPRFKDKYEPTDHLNSCDGKTVKTIDEDDIEKILGSSDVLNPDFMQKTTLIPYFVSGKKAKEIRKKESGKTKGPGWFNMKAPELTEETKRDMEVLQMRSVLDPKRHYKNDMKVPPKYFQLAEVLDSPFDFYSSRIPRNKRKRTMAEEIMHDEEALRYQKKKYAEIITSRQKKEFKHPNIPKKKKTKNILKKK